MRQLSPIQLPDPTVKVVRLQDLRAAGAKRWRCYGSDLDIPMRGTRSLAHADGTSWEVRMAALQLLLSSGQFVSRCSAAQLLSIPVPAAWQPGRTSRSIKLEVGAFRPRRPPQRKGVTGHQVRRGLLNTMPSAPDWLPDPADVWALMGAVVRVDDLIIAADHLISTVRRQRTPGCTFEQLADAVERFKGCQGIGRLKEALLYTRAGVASPPETKMRLSVVRANLPEPITNCPVLTPERELRADLGYPQWRIAIEYDGAYHFAGGAAQAKFDNDRCERMRDAGWVVLRVTSLDLQNPRPFLVRLRRAIERACSS